MNSSQRNSGRAGSSVKKRRAQPACFRRGKRFEAEVVADWLATSKDGTLDIESVLPFTGPRRRRRRVRGRMDILVEDMGNMVAVIEIKATDWDRVKYVTPLLGRHRRQVWKYVDEFVDGRDMTVCPGIIYPNPPSKKELREWVEEYLIEWGIQVQWFRE